MNSQSDAIRWQLYPLNDYPGALWQDWQRLNLQYHQGNKMLSAEFAGLLVQYFGNDLCIAIGYLNTRNQQYEENPALTDSNHSPDFSHEPVAMMLLEQPRKGVWRVFKPSQAQVGLLLMKKGLDPSLGNLIKRLPGLVTRVDFYGLDPLEHQDLINMLLPDAQCYATNIRVSLSDDFKQYWSQRPKNLRKNINRYINRVSSDLGDTEIVISTTPDDVRSATQRYGMLESKGWKGYAGTALHPSNEQGHFYQALMSDIASKNQAMVVEMYLGERLLASRLCCRSDNTLIIIKTTFDESYKKYACGRLLLRDLIEICFSCKGLQFIDFYTNASSDQMAWSTDSRPMYNASYYPATIAGLLLKSATRIKQSIHD